MTTLNKILVLIIGLIMFSAITFIAYQQYTFGKKMTEMQNSLIETKQLANGIIRSQSKLVNQAGFDSFVKENQVKLSDIQKDIQTLGGQISAVNVVKTTSKQQAVSSTPSTSIEIIDTPETPKVGCGGEDTDCVKDQYGFFNSIQKLTLFEDFTEVKVPIGEVGFRAGTNDNKPWSYNILPRQYKIANTIAHTADGQTVVYNAVSIRAGEQDYTIPVSSSETVEKYPSAEFSYWNPKVAIGLSGSASTNITASSTVKGEFTPTLNLSVMSYGRSKVNPDIRVLSIGAGYNVVAAKPSVELSPIQFNVGKAVSGTVLSNTYIGPVVGLNTDKSVYVGVGIQVGL